MPPSSNTASSANNQKGEVEMSAFDNVVKVFESRSGDTAPPGLRSGRGSKEEQEAAVPALERSLVKRKPPQQMLKGGLRDRSGCSWLQILAATVVWWACLIAFFSLCFLLMHEILHGSKEELPYFVRNQGKYPVIFDQPTLGIHCSKTTCDVRITKMFLWQPESYNLGEDSPEIKFSGGQMIKLKESLQELVQENNNADFKGVFVTCHLKGEKDTDKDLLKGMKLSSPGFASGVFPWTGKEMSEEGRSVQLELVNTRAAKVEDLEATVHCQAWARNIKTAASYQDQANGKWSRSGVQVKLCFKNGEVKKAAKGKC